MPQRNFKSLDVQKEPSPRREYLLCRARVVLDERGSEAFSVKSLAEAMGFSAAALYRHFDTRDALLAELATAEADTLLEKARACALQADPRRGIVQIGEELKSLAELFPNRFKIVFRDYMLREKYPVISEVDRNIGVLLTALVQRCAPSELAIRSGVKSAALYVLFRESAASMIQQSRVEAGSMPSITDSLEALIPIAQTDSVQL